MDLEIRGSSTLMDGCTMGSSSIRTGAANTGTACLTDTGGAIPKAGGLITSDDCGEGSGGEEKTGIVFRIVTGGAILLCELQCRTGMYGAAPAAGNFWDRSLRLSDNDE